MTEQRIKTLLKELEEELQKANSVDAETVAMSRKLEADIHALVNPEAKLQEANGENTVMDDAIALEASFAANHPVAERILRELINNLSKIGI